MALANGVKPVICFNKADLVSPRRRKEVREIYEKTDLSVILSSTKRGWGIKKLKEVLTEKITVLAGPSGVGKSSLLNAMEKGLTLKTGDISEKSSRGKHTTRHVELIRLAAGGLLADTPGFSQIYLPQNIKREELINYYPDFLKYHEFCRYNTCLHRDEPECAVRAAVEHGDLAQDRYERYLVLLDEVIWEERRY
jgi:ribosome biogenesis GTPase